MANDLIVIMGSTRDPADPAAGTLLTYLNQLHGAGIDFHLERLAPFDNIAGGGTLGVKISQQRELARRFARYDKIVMSDAFDVQMFGMKAEVIDAIYDNIILMAAERNCYPEPDLAPTIDAAAIGPWRYVNGGLTCGTPAEYARWFDAIEAHPAYDANCLDQAWFNRRLAEDDPLVEIDFDTTIFYCLFNEHGDIPDLQWDAEGHPVNTRCGTKPSFLHFNGSWPMQHIMERRIAWQR